MGEKACEISFIALGKQLGMTDENEGEYLVLTRVIPA
jgi:hypothetical protein